MHAAARPALLAFFFLTLAACKPATAPAAPEPRATPEPQTPIATSSPAPACADADFAAFLQRFASSADAQRASTADPLTMQSVDANAQPEPAPVSKEVPLVEVKFPIMFDAAERKAQGLEQSVRELAPDRQEVTVNVPDTGIQTRYEFHASPCWQLIRVSDDTF